jgi:hypothetical protein
LAEAEAIIGRISNVNRVSSSSPVAHHLPPPVSQAPQQAPQPQPSYDFLWHLPGDFGNPNAFQCPLPNVLPAADDGTTSPINGQNFSNNPLYQALRQTSHNEMQLGNTSRPSTSRTTAIAAATDSMMLDDDTERDGGGPRGARGSLSSHFDDTAHSNGSQHASSVNQSSAASSHTNGFDGPPSPATGSQGGSVTTASSAIDEATAAGVASQLKTFSMAVFEGQLELAGMASALAEYIAWMSKVPSSANPPNTKLVFSQVLDTIQERLTEMSDLARTKHHEPFRQMMASLEKLPPPQGDAIATGLANVEEDAQKREAEVFKFFQTRYNACALLSEQSRRMG